jgi:hypothetical protein
MSGRPKSKDRGRGIACWVNCVESDVCERDVVRGRPPANCAPVRKPGSKDGFKPSLKGRSATGALARLVSLGDNW